MKSRLLPASKMFVAFFSVFLCSKLDAQNILAEGRHFISIGAEGGWMRNLQSGSFKSNCDCESSGGKGNSGLASVFLEFELNPYLSFGAKFGLDLKSTSSSRNVTDEIVATNS